MLPSINGKSFLECDYTDLQLLIENSDYRENEYIDYKKNFAFLEVEDNKRKESKKVEFRNDICSFANAEGGYLIFGISDENGCASEITGITIPNKNTDNFELSIRNILNGIFPRIPNVKFHFIEIPNDKYVVMIYIKHDSYAPYTHIENELNYKFFKRSGNKKTIISYVELRNMFNQTRSLDKEILSFRKERSQHYLEQSETENDTYSQFLLFYIIPDTFKDHDYDQDVFVLQKRKRINFSSIFSGFHCSDKSLPCVDGIRFIPHISNTDIAECYIHNNGVIECFLSLNKIIAEPSQSYPNGYIPRDYIWDMISSTCDEYVKHKEILCKGDRLYLCLDLIGCKGVTSQTPSEDGYVFYTGTIDRNTIFCDPVVISDVDNDTMFYNMIHKLHLNYLLSIGVKFGKEIENLINELYP